jgi:hypothetical protein
MNVRVFNNEEQKAKIIVTWYIAKAMSSSGEI